MEPWAFSLLPPGSPSLGPLAAYPVHTQDAQGGWARQRLPEQDPRPQARPTGPPQPGLMLHRGPSHPRSLLGFVRAEFAGNESALTSSTRRCQPRPVQRGQRPLPHFSSQPRSGACAPGPVHVGRQHVSAAMGARCSSAHTAHAQSGHLPCPPVKFKQDRSLNPLGSDSGTPDFSSRFTRVHIKIKGTCGTSLEVGLVQATVHTWASREEPRGEAAGLTGARQLRRHSRRLPPLHTPAQCPRPWAPRGDPRTEETASGLAELAWGVRRRHRPSRRPHSQSEC